MKVLQRYFTSEIVRSVLFTLAAFLALFAFFDLMNELPSVGRGGYKLQHAFLFVVLGMPSYAYELMPIAALIGTIYTLSQFAARSEFTIMRVSSMSTMMTAKILLKIGLLFVVATVLIGEFVSPKSAEIAEKVKLQSKGSSISQKFKTGLWSKDVIRADGTSGDIVGSRQQVDPPLGQGLQGRLPGGETAHADLDAQHLAEDARVVGRNTFVIAFANADVERRHIGQAGAQHQLPLAAEPAPGIAIQLEIQVIDAGAAVHQQGFALLRPAGKRQQAA